jgi:hypothetical protein
MGPPRQKPSAESLPTLQEPVLGSATAIGFKAVEKKKARQLSRALNLIAESSNSGYPAACISSFDETIRGPAISIETGNGRSSPFVVFSINFEPVDKRSTSCSYTNRACLITSVWDAASVRPCNQSNLSTARAGTTKFSRRFFVIALTTSVTPMVVSLYCCRLRTIYVLQTQEKCISSTRKTAPPRGA